MTETEPDEPVYVLCCDDDVAETTIREAFESDWRRRRVRGQRTGLKLDGTVAKSVSAAKSRLERAVRDDAVPTVVLIDDYLRTRDGVARGAFELLRFVVETFPPDTRPACVLMTAAFTPTAAHAFCQQGGVQAIDKLRQAWDERIAVIWRAAAGSSWRHTVDPRHDIADGFTPRELDILPFLEAGCGVDEIGRRLGISDGAVHSARGKLFKRLVDAGLIDGPLGGRTTQVAAAALKGGAIWSALDCLPKDSLQGPV